MNNIMIRVYFAMLNKWNAFMRDERGDVNIVSIVVLIGIAVVLAVAFRKAIANLLTNLFEKINNNAGSGVGGSEDFGI